MVQKAYIQLKEEADNKTRVRFFETITHLTSLFERGLTPVYGKSKKRVHPISIIKDSNSVASSNVVWFEISDKHYVSHFASIARLEMERNLIGDKYRVVVKT